MIAIVKYQDKRKMIKRAVLASALVMVSLVVSADDDVNQKIAAVAKTFDEVRYFEEHGNPNPEISVRQFVDNVMGMCKEAIEQVEHDIGTDVIGEYFSNLESADKKAQRFTFIKNYIHCRDSLAAYKSRMSISPDDIEKRQKEMEATVESYRNGGERKITFVKKGSPSEEK
tara:strand:- start:88178 stop:88690 length:513 start_codon:yes stop_codon:yes gene_type:complete